MTELKALLTTVTSRLSALIKKNAVVAKPIVIGDCHVLTLCELRLGFGGGGGEGEGVEGQGGAGAGVGGAAGGGARATPVAVIVIENGKARVEALGQ